MTRRAGECSERWRRSRLVSGWLGPVPTMAAVSLPLTKVVVPCPIWRPARGSSPLIAFATWGRKIGPQ